MNPSPDVLKDFSRLQAECNSLGQSNIGLAQSNARLRDRLKRAIVWAWKHRKRSRRLHKRANKRGTKFSNHKNDLWGCLVESRRQRDQLRDKVFALRKALLDVRFVAYQPQSVRDVIDDLNKK